MDNLFLLTVDKYFEHTEIKEKILEKKEKFLEYIEIVSKWKEKINITGFSSEDFLFRGTVEPLLIFTKYKGVFFKEITDIGSGAGIPAISYAIFFENTSVNCIEVNKKKIAFLNFIKYSLNLHNLNISKNIPQKNFCITSRAFMNFNDFLKFLSEKRITYRYLIHFFKDNYKNSNELKIVSKIKYNNKYFQVLYQKN